MDWNQRKSNFAVIALRTNVYWIVKYVIQNYVEVVIVRGEYA
ncbi:hypothetical protein BD31_I1558 [Candidatus Nitrosopumilus salaria BD31]|uniref:Uncharacterized protein n=1 Tax=Candidatus Nitrosopumilus salarius BD31 TaxID=859350 RepID=I3D581_9ARCH|nr:hypothetical protein BD31_I1558 [Candidatus Nitrosopumilus salaria BD31]